LDEPEEKISLKHRAGIGKSKWMLVNTAIIFSNSLTFILLQTQRLKNHKHFS